MKKFISFILSLALTFSLANTLAVSADWQHPIEEIGNEEVENEDFRYCDESGNPLSGWLEISGKKYYFDDNGKKVVGKVMIDSTQYTFDKNGIWDGKPGIMFTEFDSKSVKWGDSLTAVKKSKDKNSLNYCNYNLSDDTKRYYLGEVQYIGSNYCHTEYAFNNSDELVYTQYLLLSDLSSDECLAEYKNQFMSNTEKYGKPIKNVIRWKSLSYKKKYGNDISTAIKDGYCTKIAYWETPDSIIRLKIAGVDGSIQIRMLYSDKDQDTVVKSDMTNAGDVVFWEKL